MAYNDSHYKPGPGFGLSIGSKWTRAIMILIIINVSVFVIQLLFSTISSQWGGASSGTDIDAIGHQLMPGPDQFTTVFWLYQPLAIGKLWLWQFVTYMFLHSVSSPWHIIFNMLVLWMFGSEVERAMGTRKFLTMYFTAGIFAGIFCCLFTPYSPIIGASGAIFAVEIAFAMFYPNSTIIFIVFPIKAKYLVMIFAGITVISCIMPASGNTAHFAHLGGLIYGFLFIRYEPRFSSFLLSWQKQQQEKEYQKEEDLKGQVDSLLDKVNQGGMKSLTRRERNFLRNASKRYRKTRDK
ncbi:rhomboid family protein [Candidatus Scalindua japonica]|uniref:rhomboid family protein n=1 Tax=Candidatus Scalindua japonica TaxID=1284222 RepID=UPI000BDF1414|nr:rhomboid family intramembrane serine protease [Candidatus Scalindua japonica]